MLWPLWIQLTGKQMFCVLSLVDRPVLLESFDPILVALNEYVADIDALNSTQPAESKWNENRLEIVILLASEYVTYILAQTSVHVQQNGGKNIVCNFKWRNRVRVFYSPRHKIWLKFVIIKKKYPKTRDGFYSFLFVLSFFVVIFWVVVIIHGLWVICPPPECQSYIHTKYYKLPICIICTHENEWKRIWLGKCVSVLHLQNKFIFTQGKISIKPIDNVRHIICTTTLCCMHKYKQINRSCERDRDGKAGRRTTEEKNEQKTTTKRKRVHKLSENVTHTEMTYTTVA